MSDASVEKIIHHILSILDSVDLPRRTYSAARLLRLDKNALSALYNSIPKDKITVSSEKREKSGRIDFTSDKGYEYIFTARYVINSKRTFATEEIDVDRKIPNGKFIAQVDLFRNGINAGRVTGNAKTIAKRIISRLAETEPEEIKWTVGGSFEAEAAALYNRIPRQKDESPGSKEYWIYDKGSIIVLGDDGLEYTFTAINACRRSPSEMDCNELLFIECAAIGLKRCIQDEWSFSR